MNEQYIGEPQARAIADLEAKNARLQARVEELAEESEQNDREATLLAETYPRVCNERDRYMALAERRGEALKPFALYHQARVKAMPRTTAKDSPIPVLSYGSVRLGDKHFREADAALAATPEGERR